MIAKDIPPTEERPRLTPMIDVAFLIIIFFMALPLRKLDGKIEAHLPPPGIQPPPVDEPPPQKVRITVRRSGDGFVYRLGSRRFTSHYDLLPAFHELGPGKVYEVDGSPDLPQQAIMNVVDLLHGLNRASLRETKTKHNDVQFRGGLELTLDVRRMPLLPEVRQAE